MAIMLHKRAMDVSDEELCLARACGHVIFWSISEDHQPWAVEPWDSSNVQSDASNTR
jgi:hypothetical protein